jgi:hypothetical protein
MLQENLKRANTEKSDIELTKSKLSNIMLGDSNKLMQENSTTSVEPTKEETSAEVDNETATELTDETANETPTETPTEAAEETINETPKEIPDETPEEASELPEPPVVVYVKEVGKAGI